MGELDPDVYLISNSPSYATIPPPAGGFALVNSVSTPPGSTTGATSSAISTTGASLLVCAIGCYNGNGAIVAPTDSQSNSWTALTNRQSAGSGETRVYYCISPSTSGSHTFTVPSTNLYSMATIWAFSSPTTPIFGAEASANSATTTIAAGSMTPSGANNVFVSYVVGNSTSGTASSVGGGFTITNNVAYLINSNFGSQAAYLIQTAATAANPTWTYGTSVNRAAVNAYFYY